MRKTLNRLLIIICLFPYLTKAQTQKTEILILGTTHLHHMKNFKESMLTNVIEKLDKFDFDVICVEKMSGELLNDIASRKDKAFDGITKGSFGNRYLTVADTVQKVKGITFLEAKRSLETQKNIEELSSKERKKILFNYLAVTDLPSAVLQYRYIKDKSVFETDFEKYIVDLIKREGSGNSEYYSLAASLAKLENIHKLEPIDNFQDESLLLKYYPGFMDDFKKQSKLFQNMDKLPVFVKSKRLTQEGVATNDLSGLYAFVNSDEFKKQDYDAQWGIWHTTNFESGSDRARHALWEMRNLQITGNIMKVAALNPGKRILVIIGASHGGFLEKYLKQIRDVKVLKYN
ncbi:hypothetical protein SAMN04489761_4569 [Tenacibaculum sp. MAR_2009_124]|uniref:DUF5694 domain-containing protein n=1 Tax=Tenacibaculum sp. MAR_2009_124 TaxID=1250059 RepID=UPI0008997125|nr:DUF5694 domain-containing protein [Tenacibaculum sp. MAR_2009_124]SED19170.1 hypothetical protein SAMN04489761_4569 [Tenacibaculum sp. MAR_2009_124]